MIIADFFEPSDFTYRKGTIHWDQVTIDGCGQNEGALRFDSAVMGKKVIRNSVVHKGRVGGIELLNSQQVTLDGNIVHDVVETGITAKSSAKITLINNHVSGVTVGNRKLPKERAPGYELMRG